MVRPFVLGLLAVVGTLVLPAGTATAQAFLPEPGTRLSYQHWNLERREVTGLTQMSYAAESHDGQEFIVEHSENTDPDGEAFTRKRLWFDANSGEPFRYEEEDLRENLLIINTYASGSIRTELRHGEKLRAFELEVPRERFASFETVFDYLRKQLEVILNSSKDNPFVFTLYLPALALELETGALPQSLSLVRMRVLRERSGSFNTRIGTYEAHTLHIFPDSWTLRALLPKEKSEFTLVLAAEPPYHLLAFSEGKTQHQITQLELPAR